MYTTIEEANDAYYYKYTTESSKYNIEKMHQLLKSGETEDALRGTANGIISTHHLMYKVDTLYSKDGRRGYDFLIEYHTGEPTVGIYFGCRGFTLGEYDHNEQIAIFNDEWNRIKGTVCTISTHC